MYKLMKFTPKVVASTLLLLFLLLIITYFKTWDKTQWNLQKSLKMSHKFLYDGRQFDGEKIVHLDLKGAPFKVSFYNKLFPLLSKLGATGVLMEYEDMFPYSGLLLGSTPAYNAYTLSDIHSITASAKLNNLTVIPLIQTFGHMEFILKLKHFKDFREVPQYPQVICPTHENSLSLIIGMVQQIVQAHPDIDRLHIGSDEVWYLGQCSRCKEFLEVNNLTPEQLFLKHVTTVVQEIHKKYPKLRVLMWDDHFRSMTQEDLHINKIGSLIEPVIWKYTKNVVDYLDPNLWQKYSTVFPKVWIASAFKGATGSKRYLHNASYHIENHRSWLHIVDTYRNIINFEGIFLTGWQRYDHFAILCELLPVSLPTLGMCLSLLSGSKESISPELKRMLNCEQGGGPIDVSFSYQKCYHLGSDLQEVIIKYDSLKKDFENMLNSSKVKGWVDNYNIKNEYSNPYYVESGLENLEQIRGELMLLRPQIYMTMAPIYDNYTINEWYSTYVNPFIRQVEDLHDAKEKLLTKEHWPKRPFDKEDL